MDAKVFPQIYPVTCHTDHVGPGSTFVAVKGMYEDGIKYIFLALKKGATKIIVANDAVVPQDCNEYIEKNTVELIRVKNPRKALAELSAHALDYPSKKLKIIGVTGTKGKTTTCFLLEHLLNSAGYTTALLSTVHNKIGLEIFKTDLTTKHPDYLHIFFDLCVKAGIEYVVMEVAAQALTLDRVYGIKFDSIIFTNFDQEHGEFYPSLDDYFSAKCKIFDHAQDNAPILLNADDVWCQTIVEFFNLKILNTEKSYSVILSEIKNRVEAYSFSLKNNQANFQAQIKKNDINGLELTINNEVFTCPSLFGEFNAYNITAAISLLKSFSISSIAIKQGLQAFGGVPGRLQMINLANGAQACIDKAHNPSSYQAILGTLRPLTDHLIVIFGCGGQRDKTKRPIMGKIAAEIADLIILTSDDPRLEYPEEIIEDIFVGIDEKHYNKVVKEINREMAIKIAYNHSGPTSIIAILGKGSEEYQLINGVKHHFSERTILQSL